MIHLANFVRRTNLTFVDKTHHHGDVWSFRFSPDKPLRQIAGQHSAFIIPGHGFHIFSLASAPFENYLMIGTHVREGSKYKHALDALTAGDSIHMYGPVLNFTLENAPDKVVFLAQGIGITPFRSMLIDNKQQATPRSITLIHADGAEPTFAAETEELASASYYPLDPTEFTTMLKQVVAANPNARYYLSGAGQFIKSAKATLREAGISSGQMKTDSFLGY